MNRSVRRSRLPAQRQIDEAVSLTGHLLPIDEGLVGGPLMESRKPTQGWAGRRKVERGNSKTANAEIVGDISTRIGEERPNGQCLSEKHPKHGSKF
jgi:hypothetical protein